MEPNPDLKSLCSAFPEFERQKIHEFPASQVRTPQKGDGLGVLEKSSCHMDSCRVGDPSLGINCQKTGADERLTSGQIEEVSLGSAVRSKRPQH